MKKYNVFVKFFDNDGYRIIKDVMKIEIEPPILRLVKSDEDEYVFNWRNILYYNPVIEDTNE